MKIFATLCFLGFHALVANASLTSESVTIMKPLRGAQWVEDHVEQIEWKYSPNFDPKTFRHCYVEVYEGEPGTSDNRQAIHVYTLDNMDDTGVAFRMPHIAAGDNYYVALKVHTSDGIYQTSSDAISVVSRDEGTYEIASENSVSASSKLVSSGLFALAASVYLLF